jgi:hypothetical protein
MPRDIQWSKLKKQAEAFFAPAVARRVALHITHYRTAHDWEGRGWLTIDGSEVYNFCTLRYYLEFNALSADLREASQATDYRDPEQRPRYYEAGGEAHAILEKRGIVGEKSFERSIQEYPSLSLAEALESDDFVHRALAMLDRRLGQRRLASLELRTGEHPLVLQLLEFRRRAEKESRASRFRATVAVSSS